jgi:hypothetical protein
MAIGQKYPEVSSLRGNYKDFTAIKPNDSLIDTEYGEITYLEWCEREVRRIRSHNLKIRYMEDEGKDCCCITRRGKGI